MIHLAAFLSASSLVVATPGKVCNWTTPWYHGGVMTIKTTKEAAVKALNDLSEAVYQDHPGAYMYMFSTDEAEKAGDSFPFYEIWSSDQSWLDHIYYPGTKNLVYPELFDALGEAVDIKGNIHGPCHVQELYDWFAEFGGFQFHTETSGYMWHPAAPTDAALLQLSATRGDVCNYTTPWYHGGRMTLKGSKQAAVKALADLTKAVHEDHPGAYMYMFSTEEANNPGDSFPFYEIWSSDQSWLDHIYYPGTRNLVYPELFDALGEAVDITGNIHGPCHVQDLYDWFKRFGGFQFRTFSSGYMWHSAAQSAVAV